MRRLWRRLMNRWFPYQGLYDIASREEIAARVARDLEPIKRDLDQRIATIIDNSELNRPPTLSEVSPARPFPAGLVTEVQRRAADYAVHRERAVAYGRLIGCTDEEIERTIETHRKLEVTTPYRLDWNRVEADLLVLRFPSTSLHRTYAEGDDDRRNRG